MKVLTLTCKLTNCYLLESNHGWILIDTDWPDTLPRLIYLLNQNEVNINDIKYLIVTHFHPDHAGIVQNLKDFGINLILHEIQVPFVDKLNEFFKKSRKFNYKDIKTGNNIEVSSAESRQLLKSAGINGEIVITTGHSDDSISTIINEGYAFTGDLPDLSLVDAYNDEIIKDSWKLIQDYGVRKVYPAHGIPYNI